MLPITSHSGRLWLGSERFPFVGTNGSFFLEEGAREHLGCTGEGRSRGRPPARGGEDLAAQLEGWMRWYPLQWYNFDDPWADAGCRRSEGIGYPRPSVGCTLQ